MRSEIYVLNEGHASSLDVTCIRANSHQQPYWFCSVLSVRMTSLPSFYVRSTIWDRSKPVTGSRYNDASSIASAVSYRPTNHQNTSLCWLKAVGAINGHNEWLACGDAPTAIAGVFICRVNYWLRDDVIAVLTDDLKVSWQSTYGLFIWQDLRLLGYWPNCLVE